MKILLINPPRPPRNLMSVDAANVPPIALEYLAAELPADARIKIIDAIADNLSTDDVVLETEAFQPDWVGLTALTLPAVSVALEIAGRLKQSGLAAPIVMGGMAVAGVAADVLQTGCIDYVVFGEGEVTFSELISGREPREIPGLAFWNRGEMILTPPQPATVALDDHLPARLCDRARYNAFGKRVDVIQTSRGTGENWRARSAASVVQEIEHLVSGGAQLLMIVDDQFMHDMARVSEICERLTQQEIHTLLWCPANLATLCREPDTIARMRQAGFIAVMVTLEARELADGGEGYIREAIKTLHENDIGVWATVIIGGITAEEPSHPALVAALEQLDLEFVQFAFATPYPGTKLYSECARKGLLLSHRWTDYVPHRLVIRNQIPVESANGLLSYLYKSYYLRGDFAEPRIWAKLVREDPRMAKFIQMFNPAGIKTARDLVREGFLKSIWTTLIAHYCIPSSLAEWAALFDVAKHLVNSDLADLFAGFTATICLNLGIEHVYLSLLDGEIQSMSTGAESADLTLEFIPATLWQLVANLTGDPAATFPGAFRSGSYQTLGEFTRYVQSFQTYLRPWCHCGVTVPVTSH